MSQDAEIRYEEHISKLVLEKQELDWQQESLQHQIEAMSNQHTEALASVKKQFQAKIRGVEEEKGKHQLHAESKDKEIKSLKEELKLLQLSTYSLEKKASELEQKLTLQSRSKDSLLNQLGEVEKRFGALSRLCAVVKQDHENLELNVDEAMRINTKLTSMKEKHESTITSLKLELEELNNKLMKTKLWSVVHTESNSHSAREQHAQQLQQRLLMETELNKKLMDENATERAQKQDLMRLLQHAQQLLLSQTQAVSGAELELQKHRQVYQALKREHEVMRERSEASEDRVARLTEDCASSKTLWEKEKTMFLERFKCEQQHLHALREAFDQLHQKHTELSSQAILHTQHVHGQEIRDHSRPHRVSTLMSAVAEGTIGEGPLNELNPSSELPSLCSLQDLVPSQTRDPDCLVVTEAVDKLAATGAAEVQPTGETSWSDSRRVYESCVGIGVKNVGPLRSQASPSSDMGPCTTNTPAEEEISGHQQHTEDARLTPNEKVLKLLNPSCHENDASPEILKHPPAKEHLFGDIDYSCLSSNKNYRFSFEWVSAQRRKVPPESEVNTRGSAGFPGWSSPRTIPTFLKGKQNRDPSVISRASDLLSASSVSGLPSSTKRDQRGEWKAIRETASGVTESRASLSISSAPISTSSSTTGRLSWPSASGTLTPAPGPCPGSGSGSDWFPSISQEGEDQLSSFRAQISKSEQFLCAERPRLPKRQRTDD
ncbi:coiled-coil domain-containing protein 73 [Polymixia lowei]